MWKLLLLLSTLGLAVGVLAGCASTAGPQPEGEPGLATLERQINDIAKHYPALSYGATRANGPVFTHQTGMAGIAEDQQLLPETPMYVFSLTKLFTSLGVVQVADRGFIDLDREVKGYLPWVPYPGSVRQFLSHSAGVPDPIWGTFYVHPPEKHAGLDRDQLLREITIQHPESLFAPGTDSSYSNLGYAILGALIEAATGLRWERYIKDEILDPLGMSRSGSDPTRLPGLANSYVSRSLITRLVMGRVMPWIEFTPEGKFRSIQREYFFDLPAHGGLVIAPVDLERFVRAVVLRDSDLMSTAAWDAWLEPQDDAGGEYSLGWRVARHERGTLLFHSGGAMGHSAHVRIYVDQGVGTFAQTNILDTKRLVRRDIEVFDEALFETL